METQGRIETIFIGIIITVVGTITYNVIWSLINNPAIDSEVTNLIIVFSVFISGLLIYIKYKSWKNIEKLEELTDQIVDIIPQNIQTPNANPFRITIYIPKRILNARYLVGWKYGGRAPGVNKKFYIGNKNISDLKKIGVAGKVFKFQKEEIIKLREVDGKITAENDYYNDLGLKRIEDIGYTTFICFPIINKSNRSLGVLSIDCMEIDAFDNTKLKDKLKELINIFEHILELKNKSYLTTL